MNPSNLCFTVIIPTMGRTIIVQTLTSLLAADGAENLEVLILGRVENQEVSKKLSAIIQRHQNIRHMPVLFPAGDLSRKKNLGIQESRCEINIVIDDDLVVPREWLKEITAPFADPNVAMVVGPSLTPEDIGFFGRLAGLTLASRAAGYVSERYTHRDKEVSPIKWSRVIGCNMAFRKAMVAACGGFNASLIPGEDLFLGYELQKNGYGIVSNQKAFVWHYPRQSLRLFCRQIYRFGAARIRLNRAGVDFEWATAVPAVWVLSLIILGFSAPFCGLCAFLLKLELALYVLMAAGIALETVAQTRRLSDLLLFFMIPVMHFSYGLAEWFEYVHPNRDLSEVKSAC